MGKSDINTGTLATLEETFHLASSKFKIADLNDNQKLAIRKTVVEKDDIFVYLLTGSGKSLIYQCKIRLTGLHDSHVSWHLYICRSLYGLLTFFVASLVFLKGVWAQ